MKPFLTIISIFLFTSFAAAQGGNCKGDDIKVYKGGTGCGCKCMKECVTPAELPTYLANGWNTDGCWQCCKFFNGGWVSNVSRTTIDNVVINPDAHIQTITYTLVAQGDVKLQVTDMTGRVVQTLKDEFREDLENELIWDDSKLEPGVYVLTLEAGGFSDSKKVSVTN